MKTKILKFVGAAILVVITGVLIGMWGSNDTAKRVVQPQTQPAEVLVQASPSTAAPVQEPTQEVKLEAHVNAQFDTK